MNHVPLFVQALIDQDSSFVFEFSTQTGGTRIRIKLERWGGRGGFNVNYRFSFKFDNYGSWRHYNAQDFPSLINRVVMALGEKVVQDLEAAPNNLRLSQAERNAAGLILRDLPEFIDLLRTLA